MALSSRGSCTCNLNVSGYGLGENVTVSYRSPKPLSADAIDAEYAGYTIVDIDAAPMVSGNVTLTQEVGGVTQSIIDDNVGEGYYWDFNIFTEYEYVEQGYGTIGSYTLSIDTLTYSYAVLTDYSVEPPVTVRLGTIIIGNSTEPAVTDMFVYSKGEKSDAYGDMDRDVLFIPYKNTR